MRKITHIFIGTLLFVFIGCVPNRYVLLNDIENKNFLIDVIKDYQKQGLVGNKPIIVLDGIPHRYNYELKDSTLSITKNEIETIEVLKKDAANQIYGQYAKDGVILITTKTELTKQTINDDIRNKNILYIVDGIHVKGYNEIQNLNPKDIASITVIKQQTVFSLYSDDLTLEGIIIINTKHFLIKKYRKSFSKYSSDYRCLVDSIPIKDEYKLINYYVNDSIFLQDNLSNKLDSISDLNIHTVDVFDESPSNGKVKVNIKLDE